MAISLKMLNTKESRLPPSILIYGTEGIGKTTLASEFPKPAFLQTEDGAPRDLEVMSFGHLTDFAQVMEAIAWLYAEEHDRKTVVVDSLSNLQRLVWQEVCARGDEKGEAKARIDDFGYGKGYGYALNVWQEFLEGINALRIDRGMTVIFIAHGTIREFKDPETEPYDRYEIDLHSSKTKTSTLELFKRETDAIFILKREVQIKKDNPKDNRSRARGEGGSIPWICTKERPSYAAKSRFPLPEKIPYQKGQGFKKLEPFIYGKAIADEGEESEVAPAAANGKQKKAA